MTKKNFTLEDIKNYLLELGFVWEDKIIYNPNTRKYRTATMRSFEKNVFLCLRKEKQTQDFRMLAVVDNNTFELWCNNSKMDASYGWLDFLSQKDNKVIV